MKTKCFIASSKEVGLDVKVEKKKCILVSRYQIAGQNQDTETANKYVKLCRSSNICE
jgi:hypothetical protein